jgi:hypothetical protein
MPTRLPQHELLGRDIRHRPSPPLSRAGLAALVACAALGCSVWGNPPGPSATRSSVLYGFVKQVPHNRTGLWFIGRETIESDAFTDIQEYYGQLAIGSCVAVEKRGNRARRIVTMRAEACGAPRAPERVLR